MSVKTPTRLEIEVINFQEKVQRIIDNSAMYHESLMRDEEALKRLLERIGEIPNNTGPNNEHTPDA